MAETADDGESSVRFAIKLFFGTPVNLSKGRLRTKFA